MTIYDGMIKLGDVQYQTEPNLSIVPKEILSTTAPVSVRVFFQQLTFSVMFPFGKAFVKCLSMSVFVCKRHFWWVRYDVISTLQCCSVGL